MEVKPVYPSEAEVLKLSELNRIKSEDVKNFKTFEYIYQKGYEYYIHNDQLKSNLKSYMEQD